MWVPLHVGNLPFGEMVQHSRWLVRVLKVNNEQALPSKNERQSYVIHPPFYQSVVIMGTRIIIPVAKQHLRGKDDISTARRDTHTSNWLFDMYGQLLGHSIDKRRGCRSIIEGRRRPWKDRRVGVVKDMESRRPKRC
jgi:hypothetical protein